MSFSGGSVETAGGGGLACSATGGVGGGAGLSAGAGGWAGGVTVASALGMVAGGIDVIVVGVLDEEDMQPTPIVKAVAEKSRIVRFINGSPEDVRTKHFPSTAGAANAGRRLQFNIVDHSAPVSFLISSGECR